MFTTVSAFVGLTVGLLLSGAANLVADGRPPNLVVIFIDDLGFADIGPFGATRYPTPHLDRMAAEGMRFTDFVVSSAVCSASRAGLLTGCYHQRIGVFGALGPQATHGLNPDELTLAELCRSKGYATACYGKWHLGHHPKFLPLNHGFDEYFGLPYSNDMWPWHPETRQTRATTPARRSNYPNLPLIEDNQVIDSEVTGDDQSLLTRKYTERAISFIERNRDRPFFLYVPHSMVHVPLFASKEFHGRSGAGLFADVMMEVDWSVGQIMEALKRSQVDDNTWVVFTSDNGPWLSYGNHAGSAEPLREGKGTSFEGGFRVPTLMRWPGVIPANTVCDELASTIDLLPSMAHWIDAPLPAHKIDGRDIRTLMRAEPDAQSPHESFCYFYAEGELQAIRDRRWKLYFPHTARSLGNRHGGRDGVPANYEPLPVSLALYDLKHDIHETHDVAGDYPEVVNRLREYAERAREELGDSLSNRTGTGVRPAGQLNADDPRLTW